MQWDTDFFGVNCAKATLHKNLTSSEWEELKTKFKGYQFISIENSNSEPVNAQAIGRDTPAFLADVNIQFKKKIDNVKKITKNIKLYQSMERNDEVLSMAEFNFSKFIEDPELAKRNGNQVYRQWLISSFEKPDKFYALSENENGEIDGFLLYSYEGSSCIVELIVATATKSGIGTSLFKAVEKEAYKRNYDEIRVGTQMRNMRAINFYHKMGCKQVGCHQVYHLWDL